MKTGVSQRLNYVIVSVLCLVIAAGILLYPKPVEKAAPIEFDNTSSVNAICELATLRSFYHNVIIYEQKPDEGTKFLNNVVLWPIGNLLKLGYKQFWMEYSGIVETGINASQIRINGPDANGIVEIFVPDAEILNVYADESTLTEPLSAKGLFENISGEEKANAFSSAQFAMRQEAEADQSLLMRAKENAKVLLKRYIINTGKAIGVDLTVRWAEDPF